MTPEQRLKSIPPSYRKTYLDAMAGHSRAKAVKAFCQECIGYERKLIRQCTDTGCPLFPYRPYQVVKEKKTRKEEEDTNKEDTNTDTITSTSSSRTKETDPLKRKKIRRRNFGQQRRKKKEEI